MRVICRQNRLFNQQNIGMEMKVKRVEMYRPAVRLSTATESLGSTELKF